MFRTEAIVLKKTHTRDKNYRFVLFSREFGKIGTWVTVKKHFEHTDTGSIISGTIRRKGTENQLEDVHVTHPIAYQSLGYAGIATILRTIEQIHSTLPDGVPFEGLYLDYRNGIRHLENRESSRRFSTLYTMKLLRSSGVLPQTPFREDRHLYALYSKILSVPLERTMELDWMNEGRLEAVEAANTNCLINYQRTAWNSK